MLVLLIVHSIHHLLFSKKKLNLLSFDCISILLKLHSSLNLFSSFFSMSNLQIFFSVIIIIIIVFISILSIYIKIILSNCQIYKLIPIYVIFFLIFTKTQQKQTVSQIKYAIGFHLYIEYILLYFPPNNCSNFFFALCLKQKENFFLLKSQIDINA